MEEASSHSKDPLFLPKVSSLFKYALKEERERENVCQRLKEKGKRICARNFELILMFPLLSMPFYDGTPHTTRKESFYDEFIDDENIFIINKIIYDKKLNSSLIIKYL